MQAEQHSKESKKDDSHEPSLKKMMKKDLSEGPKVTESASKQGNNINGQSSSQNDIIRKDSLKNDDSSSSDCIILKHKEGYQPTSQQPVDVLNGVNEEDEDDDDVQIISVIDSSSSEGDGHQPKVNHKLGNPSKLNSAVPMRKDSGSGSSSKTKKKNTNRCKICKKGGSTLSFKPCKDCARLFHYECIGMKKELDKDKKYSCDQCKDKVKLKRAVEREKEKKKKIKEKEKEKERQLKIESILAEAKKKLEKPKENKKEETQKFFEEFSVKYPQFVENKKIKFPIEDTLLTIYSDKFQDSLNLAKRPHPNQSKIIPQEHMNDILMIWNFLNSFSEHLEFMKFTKEQLYIAIDHKGEESHSLLNHIFRNLVRFPVLDIYYTHKIDNHKELSDQPFFIITRVAKEIEQLDVVMHIIWPEFIRHLSFFQQYSINFKDDELITEIVEKMKSKDFSGFFDLSTNQRIKFMVLLIACVDDSDSFHDGVIGYKQEQVHEMTKERNDLQVEIKKDELEFQALDTKVKAFEQTHKEQSTAILETLSRAESLKKSKELDKDKKELQKLKNQVSKVEQALIKKKNKCQQLTYDLPHYINTAQLLGYDHNKSEFWFFHNDRKTIYLRYKESIIDDDRAWCFYNTKEEITNLIKSLNKKGIREKNLFDNLMYLVKNGYLQYKFEDFEKKPVNTANNNNNTNNGTQQKDAQTSGSVQTTLHFNSKNGLSIAANGETPAAEEKKEMEIEENSKNEETHEKEGEQQNGDAAKQSIEEEDEVEQTKEQIIQYISNYDAFAVTNKTTTTTHKKKGAKGNQQNDKELTVFQRAKCTFQDVGMIILETEKNFTDYLERRKSRWANKQIRETFREKVKNCTDPQEILTLLEQLNDGFSAVDHMFIKEGAKILENGEDSSKIEQEENYDDNQSVVSDDDSFQGMGKAKNGKNPSSNAEKQMFTLEFFENHPQMRSKKLPMRIWGIYSDKCKKNWQNLPMVNLMSAYLSAYMFCSIMQRFLQRKKEQAEEKLLNEQNSILPTYYTAEDKKNIGSSNSLNQKRKLINIGEIDNYRNTDGSLRRSDRQRYRKDMSEPNYDLEDFEEEEGQEEVEQDNNKRDEDEEEEYNNKSGSSKKGKKYKNEDEEDYDADKNDDDEEDEDEDEEAGSDDDDAAAEEDEEDKATTKGGKRKLTKQKDIKKPKGKNYDEEEDQDMEEEEEVVAAPKSKQIKKGKGKQTKKPTNKQNSEDEEEEEEEFNFYKKKDDKIVKKKEDKNDKKSKYKEVSEEEEDEDEDQEDDKNDDEEEEEEQEFTYSKIKNTKNSNQKNTKSKVEKKQEWDEQCKVCKQHGEVLMCDTCPSVFHLKCIGLKSLPEGDWSCIECQTKILKQRQTRSAAKKHKFK